jgi:hypothetical protein
MWLKQLKNAALHISDMIDEFQLAKTASQDARSRLEID